MSRITGTNRTDMLIKAHVKGHNNILVRICQGRTLWSTIYDVLTDEKLRPRLPRDAIKPEDWLIRTWSEEPLRQLYVGPDNLIENEDYEIVRDLSK